MAENIKRHITHIKSKVVEEGSPKLPTSSQIELGELAINYAKGYETLSIKNESGETVTFLPRPYNSARGGETLHPIFDGTGTAGGTKLSAAWSGNCADIKTLYDGLTILYKIKTAGHASGDTLSINGGEAHKVLLNYNSPLTTHYPVNSIIKLTYDSTESASFYTGSTTQKTTTGVWKIENYDSNSNTTHIYDTYYNGSIYKAGAATYRYQILLSKDETTLIPASNGNNSTANTKTITTEEFNPFAPIFYYNSTATTNASAAYTSGVLNDCMTLSLTYSFNVASVLTAQKDVYLVAVPQSNGKAKLRNPATSGATDGPISQTLPTTDDGYIYIYLGAAYNTTAISLARIHPVYQFKNGQLRQYVGSFGTMAFANTSSYSSATEVNTALSGKAGTGTSISTASGLTGGGNLSTNRTIGLAATGTSGTYYCVKTDAYGRVTSGSTSNPNTDTKVTAVSNHYAPTATSADTKSANASSTSELAWGSAVVTGVTLSGDAKGHITSVTVASGKLKTPVTGVTLASGTNNGTLKLTVNGTATDNIAVKGLGTMAYEATSSYSSATQVNTALAEKSNTGHTHDDRYYTESELTGSSTTVVVAKASSATTAASAGSVAWSNVSGKPSSFTPSAHNQASNTITAMTGYSKPSSTSAIATTDTLNAAIGKLEFSFGGLKLVQLTQSAYDTLTTKDDNTLYIITD